MGIERSHKLTSKDIPQSYLMVVSTYKNLIILNKAYTFNS